MIRRWIFNFAAAVSLLLCVATVALWVRSYHTKDHFDELRYLSEGRIDTERFTDLVIWQGELELTRGEQPATTLHEPEHPWQRFRPWPPPGSVIGYPFYWPAVDGPPPSVMDRLGFTWRQAKDSTDSLIYLSYPLWAITAAMLLLPLAWCVHAIWRFRRCRMGCCTSCGYNLTANTSGVCPECGTPVPAATAKKTPA